jgi:hypothetical protein
MKHILSALLLAALCAVILPSAALADVAPPHQPPGFNPGPGSEVTQVRMMAETVTIDVLAIDPPQAHVSALFTMHNLGSSTESMAVRFPIAASDGFSRFPEIKNVSILVNNRPTPFERIQGPEPVFGFDGQNVPWASFGVSFTAGDDVQIKVSYDLDGTGYPQETFTSFYYTLSTGAGWNGTIGSGEIILRLPYDANPQNVVLEDSQNAVQFAGREARWEFTDLEPTTRNNLTFDIVKPAVWKQVLTEFENISHNAQDGEAYGRLGKAYKQALFAASKGFPRTDPGAAVIYQWSKDAYDKAVTLKPTDGLWHAGYAELLLDYTYWGPDQGQNHPYTADLHLGLQQLALACQFAPKDPKVLDMIDRYSSTFPDYIVKKSDGSLDFLSLTQTPQPILEATVPTETPIPSTGTPSATQTTSPTPPRAVTATIPAQTPSLTSQPATAVPVAKPTPKPSSPICGGAALILLPAVLIAWKLSRSR